MKIKYIGISIFSILLIFSVFLVNTFVFTDVVYVNDIYMHASIETIGGVTVILMALLLITNREFFDIEVFGIVHGFIFMGIFIIFHSMVNIGDSFVFFFSFATLFGAIGITLSTILEWKKISISCNLIQGFISLFLSIVLGLIILEVNIYPDMTNSSGFTNTANYINITAGILYLFSLVVLVSFYKKSKNVLQLILAISVFLLFISSISFPFSKIWTISWWGWHYVRFIGFLSLIGFVIYLNKKNKDELIIRNREIEHVSYHDSLTGLYNRRYYETYSTEIDKTKDIELTIIMADINGLKLVNDAFGHKIGDQLLTSAASLMKDYTPKEGKLCRIGGDEFVFILPGYTAIDGEKIISDIISVSKDVQIENISLSISFGVAERVNELSISELFIIAEDRMYQQKLVEVPSMRGTAINAIMSTLNEKDPMSEQHVRNVSRLSELMAKAMGLPANDIAEVRNAALLHDIGKIIIPIHILNKDGKLTSQEYNIIKTHPEIGFRILNSSAETRSLAQIILAHHEHWDGNGYPYQLKQQDIPIKARIISVADAFDAMISVRSYKKAFSIKEALEELKRCKGTQFDPTIVDVFSEHFEEIMKEFL